MVADCEVTFRPRAINTVLLPEQKILAVHYYQLELEIRRRGDANFETHDTVYFEHTIDNFRDTGPNARQVSIT